MMWFWVLAVAMILLSLGFVIPPLLSKRAAVTVENDTINLAIYRQKMAELEANEENLTAEQLVQAKQELEQGLLQDVGPTNSATPAQQSLSARTQRQVAAIIAVLIPVTALILYAEFSPPQWTQLVEYNPAEAAKAKTNMPSVDEMVAKLEAKLQANPQDPKGWALLGRSYYVMGRFAESVNAYAEANRLSQEKDVVILADYAEVLAMANDGQLAGQATATLQKALTIEPNHPKSLWLAGTAAFQIGKFADAIRHWETLYNMHQDKNNEGAQILQKQIAEARAKLGDKAPAPTVAKTAPAAGGKTEIQVSVNLDAKLKGRAAPEDTVFIFARAAQGPGMPLAIVKKQVKDLPVTVTLNDTMSMMPDMTLSNFPQVYVGARISKSGNATPQSGDLQGRSSPLNTGKAQQIKVTIDQEVL